MIAPVIPVEFTCTPAGIGQWSAWIAQTLTSMGLDTSTIRVDNATWGVYRMATLIIGKTEQGQVIQYVTFQLSDSELCLVTALDYPR